MAGQWDGSMVVNSAAKTAATTAGQRVEQWAGSMADLKVVRMAELKVEQWVEMKAVY